MPRSSREIRRFTLVLAVLAGAVNGCVGAGSGAEDPLKGETHYTLRRGVSVVHPRPLPVETPILVDHFRADGSKSTSLGFRGWDVNGDGRFEMVEVLNEDGTVQARLFDFDEDGRVDLVRRERGEGAPP